ncbi:pantetheine-phosphate adenylyltransferase [Arcanobacterium haemolyticum]|uniref:Phosphopantetheine adenylyltransferase n=1 Tax=Arcanobacterium haemolyticum (strain ATCC 9345 / DSM 20595 / CCM 5947 / CCUG 17215 / LMG 16163 / NBRC 15585 / NCTC 8452 / 11018) TaxID=644284 RepID=D7BPE8_ARCHD|nr:pantetheine-phosphate adenylyltransferase [Arcanobacterium haemolyticum]ADH92797.1 pantetheine-phosphate adenylyltransferase [Arcanobacterium haemolyticum DSM 20595]QCX46887.1 pantetheine-phosphate adenylyltransferase [Arcanobacterium haemolyticum]SPT74643.1 Phosphopantetheine adenylyltransferase [Arcanobacterium haemolyticum]SQH28455.1 Phosphopantetheine adenylyltransferase [Arcanobacterium haemolyticum]
MSCAICPGSFDPITLGHVDVVERAHRMFGNVIVAVARNSAKKYLFTDDERVQLAREAVAHIPNVTVELVDGLIADFAQKNNANAIVKGVRGSADYDSELPMSLLNRHLSGVETVFVMGEPSLAHIASSFVKELAQYGGPYEDLVPANVAHALKEKVNA